MGVEMQVPQRPHLREQMRQRNGLEGRGFSLRSIVGPLPSDWWESYFTRSVWSLRHPRAPWSPVTVRIAAPEPRGPPSARPVHAIHSAGPSPSEKPPDPCAKETVLRALRGRTKGTARWEELPCPGGLQGATRSPDPWPSAFRPLAGNGVLTSFVPRSGPVKRSRDPRGSDLSGSPAARAPWWGPPRSGRNAISSSYSSSSELCEAWKRSAPGTSLHTPEWPVRKKGKGHQSRSPGPPPPAKSQGQETPLSPSPPPPLGAADPGDDPASRQKVGLGRSNEAGEHAPAVPARRVPAPWSAIQPSASPGQPSAGAARSPDTDPQLGSLAETREPPPASPPAAGRAVPAARSLPTELGARSRGVSGSEPRAPAPATDTTRPPSAAQAGGTATPREPPAVTPAPLTVQSVSSGMSGGAPLLPVSAPPGAAPADPTPHPILELPPRAEIGDSLQSRISATVSACSPPGLLTPTFKPIFGSRGALNTEPRVAPFSSEQAPPPATPAAPHLLHGLVKATAVVMSTTPATTSDSSLVPPVDFGAVSVSGTVGHAYPTPATCHTLLLRASCTCRAGLSQAASSTFPAHPRAALPTVHTVTIFSQLLSSAVQMSPSKSTASVGGTGSPLPASASAARSQPALTSCICGVSSTPPAPSGSGSRPPFPPSPGAPLQLAPGPTDGQKQGAPQPPLGPRFSRSFSSGKSALASPIPAPTPAGPAFSKPAQSASGGLAPSASACHVPSGPPGILPNFGSVPAGVPMGQAGATGFGAATQAHASGARGSVFGSTAPRPFAFGGLVTPMDCGEPGVSATAPDMHSSSGAFGTRQLPSGTAGTVSPFGKGWSQNAQGVAGPSLPFVLGTTNSSSRKTMSGGHAGAQGFAQSTRVPRPVKRSSGLGPGMPSLPAQGSVGRGLFRPSASSFSIGAKSKTPRTREQGHSRRHHAHKK
ncbi:POM121-like protein 2 [Crocuta crocuta]